MRVDKQCAKCGSNGPFGKKANRPDGSESLCKQCVNDKQRLRNCTPEGKAATAWQSILKRAGNRNGANPTYATVEVHINRQAFMEWAVPAFAEWVKANPGKVPSVNRIHNNQGYAEGNLEIIDRGENSRRRPANKNVHAPSGLAWCSDCKQYLPRGVFRASPGHANGLSSKCRTCDRKYHREYQRRYVSANRETIQKYQREWYHAHKSQAPS